MTGREVMNRLREDVKRRAFLRRLRSEIHMEMGNSGIDYSADRVQASPKDPIFEEACRMMTRLQGIDSEVAMLTERINRAIDYIRKVTRARPADVLMKRYYNGFPLRKIADDLGYSYAQIKRDHGDGLRELDAILPPNFGELWIKSHKEPK